jgi:phospholipid/cholesterol/gamma-HCH transport system substrate-binding protein
VKISNEFKVGLLGIIVIVLLILGFNFLKGNKLFSKTMTLHAKYQNVQGLATSNPVFINGLQVGNIYAITNSKDMKQLLVTISIQKEIYIPTNSIAFINPNPLSVTKIEIQLGDATTYLKSNDTIKTIERDGFLENMINSKVDPLLSTVKSTIGTADSILLSFNQVLDAENKKNIAAALQNLNKITTSVNATTASLETMLNSTNGPLSKTLNNAASITDNIAANNKKLNNVFTNIDITTEKLAKLNVQQSLSLLDSTINNLKAVIAKLNSKESSLGLLFNDPTLYKNLTSTSNKINVLLDDIRVHPSRYVSISIFGKKEKQSPLNIALPDTISSPYINKK